MTYNVVLLIEEALTDSDTARITSLHGSIEDEVAYTVLVPVEDAAAKIEASLAMLPTLEYVPPAVLDQEVDVEGAQKQVATEAENTLVASVKAFAGTGRKVGGRCIHGDVIETLADEVKALDADEAIILTRPHVVAEFFHVDWTSKARRSLGVPVLHLIEHETFDAQAGEGEGATLI